jgi:hypothetical protein
LSLSNAIKLTNVLFANGHIQVIVCMAFRNIMCFLSTVIPTNWGSIMYTIQSHFHLQFQMKFSKKTVLRFKINLRSKPTLNSLSNESRLFKKKNTRICLFRFRITGMFNMISTILLLTLYLEWVAENQFN